MTLYIAADHRGFALKEKLHSHFQSEVIVVDCGNKMFNPEDDYVDWVAELAKHMAQDTQGLGVVLCSSGCGVAISANRYAHLRATTATDQAMLEVDCRDDLVNVLAIGADYITYENAISLVHAFIRLPRGTEKRYLRRVDKLSQLGSVIA